MHREERGKFLVVVVYPGLLACYQSANFFTKERSTQVIWFP
jgi:hypothetical protein